VICVTLSVVTRLPPASCTCTVRFVLPSVAKSDPGPVITTCVGAPGVTVILSLAGLLSKALLVIATSKVSTTVSTRVTVATPPTTVTVSAPPTTPYEPSPVPVTAALIVPLNVGLKVIWVALSVVTRLPPESCTCTVRLVLPSVVKSDPAPVIATCAGAPALTVILSLAGLLREALLVIATSKVSTTVSTRVTVATPPATVTVSAPLTTP